MSKRLIVLTTVISVFVFSMFLQSFFSIPPTLKEGPYSNLGVILHYIFWWPYFTLRLNLLMNPIVLRIGHIFNIEGPGIVWYIGPPVMGVIYGLILGEVLIIIKKIKFETKLKRSN